MLYPRLFILLAAAAASLPTTTQAFMKDMFIEDDTPTQSPAAPPRNDDDGDDATPAVLDSTSSLILSTSEYPSLQPSDGPSMIPSGGIPSTMPSDMPSQIPALSMTPSSSLATTSTTSSSLAPSSSLSTEIKSVGVDFHYGQGVSTKSSEQVVYTCGGVPLEAMTTSTTASVAYSIPYSYRLQFDATAIENKDKQEARQFIQDTLDTMQTLMLDAVLYSACGLRQVLQSDRDIVALAASQQDEPLGECGNYCLVVTGAIDSYAAASTTTTQGLVECNAAQAIHDLLASVRIERLDGVTSVEPYGASANDPLLCLPATVAAAAILNGVVEAVDYFSTNSYYTCDGALADDAAANDDSIVMTAEPTQVDYAYMLTISDDGDGSSSIIDQYTLVNSIHQLLYYAILESSCYTAAAVQKEGLLTVSAAPSDKILAPCGDNCFSIQGGVTFIYPDEFGIVQCAIINALFAAFQSDSILNMPGVASVSFDSEDLLYTCIRNDLSQDPDYDPGNAFQATEETGTQFRSASMNDSVSVAEKATALVIGGGIAFVATAAVIVAMMLLGQSKSHGDRHSGKTIHFEHADSMEAEEDCTPRKLFGDDDQGHGSRLGVSDPPAIYFSAFSDTAEPRLSSISSDDSTCIT